MSDPLNERMEEERFDYTENNNDESDENEDDYWEMERQHRQE